MTPSPLVISDQLWQLKEVYKGRHLMENFFASIKGYRGSATRYGTAVEPGSFPRESLG